MGSPIIFVFIEEVTLIPTMLFIQDGIHDGISDGQE